jgi:hypothetical protein
MLNEPTIPPVIRRTFDRNLAAFLRPDDPRPPDNERAIRPAQQVFSLGLEPLSNNQPIRDHAKAANWRFLIAAGSGKGLYATVTRHDHEPAEFIGLSRGAQAAVAVQADQDLRKLPAAQAEKYNLCVLAIPGLLTEAFWLKWVAPDGTESDPSKDLIVPFVTAQKQLMPMHPYSVEEFTIIAGPLAKDRLDAFQQLETKEQATVNQHQTAAKGERSKTRSLRKPPGPP